MGGFGVDGVGGIGVEGFGVDGLGGIGVDGVGGIGQYGVGWFEWLDTGRLEPDPNFHAPKFSGRSNGTIRESP